MKLKIFTFRYSDEAAGFDDQPLQEFISDKEIIEYTEHFFIHEKIPHLTILCSYRTATEHELIEVQRRSNPRTDLAVAEKTIYDALRTWRAAKAKQEGIPPYLIATNRQLAMMVKLRAATKSELATIEGIGEIKIDKHGDEILAILASTPEKTASLSPPATPGESA